MGSENKDSPSQTVLLMEELMARTRAERKILKMMSSVIGTGTCGDDTGTPNVKRGDEKS